MRLIPYREDQFGLTSLQDRMNGLFDSFFNGGRHGVRLEHLWPSIDVVETPETVQVKAEMPGIEPEAIDISVTADTLTIKGEKTAEKEEKGKTWHRRERSAGQFVRSITLPVSVDPDHVEAVNEAGVLTITLPKRELAKTKRIVVKSK